MSKFARIYIRVSTGDQAEKGKSLETQTDLAVSFCKKNGFEYKIYKDEGISGTSTVGREALELMINEIERGNTVIFYDFSRRARKVKDDNEIVERIRAKGGRIYFTSMQKYEGYVSSTDMMSNDLQKSFAQAQSIKQGDTTSVVMNNMAKNGKLRCRPPFGEKKVPGAAQGTPFMIDEDEMMTIHRMFEMKREEPVISYARMARILNEEKCPTKTKTALWDGKRVHTVMDKQEALYNKWLDKRKRDDEKRIENMRSTDEDKSDKEKIKQLEEMIKILMKEKIDK